MEIGDDQAVYVISVAAELASMHPQTLRQYDRMGLVTPRRTAGRGRRYSPRDIEKLRLIQSLSQEEGINLAGIKRILLLREQVSDAQSQVDSMTVQLQAALSRLAQANRIFAAGMAAGDVTVADPRFGQGSGRGTRGAYHRPTRIAGALAAGQGSRTGNSSGNPGAPGPAKGGAGQSTTGQSLTGQRDANPRGAGQTGTGQRGPRTGAKGQSRSGNNGRRPRKP